jgi:D-beta-D-heptose 7-phosphate kinase/D-beta-D-heptose 1-phosphate adenosyltransferase
VTLDAETTPAGGDRLTRLAGRFAGLDVVVLGDAMLDRFLHGAAAKLSREAPVPVVEVDERVDAPGGAANTALNAAALGARVRLLATVGADPAGEALLALLRDGGVDVTGVVVDPARPTPLKERVVAGGHMLVRVDHGGAPAAAGPDVEARLVASLRAAFAGADAVVVSDYACGAVTPAVRAALGGLQAAEERLLVVDAKDLAPYAGLRVTAVTPSFAEIAPLVAGANAVGEDRARAVDAAGADLLAALGVRVAAVTLDRDGAVAVEAGRPSHRTWLRRAVDGPCPGAGDAFTAALALALAAGADAPAAAELASVAATAAVGGPGTAVCTAGRLRSELGVAGKVAADAAVLAAQVGLHRRAGRSIVVTNGVFDILHRGHVAYLNQAKALGDVLVVAVNGDASVARLKGPDRPINPLEDRLEVLAALSCVDHLVAFAEDSPAPLLEALRPDVYVKGGDYTPQTLPEHDLVTDLGGRVELLPYVADRSTTRIVDAIRRAP